MFVTNQGTVACCGEAPNACKCGNDRLPAGGSLTNASAERVEWSEYNGEPPLALNAAADLSDKQPAGGSLAAVTPPYKWDPAETGR